MTPEVVWSIWVIMYLVTVTLAWYLQAKYDAEEGYLSDMFPAIVVTLFGIFVWPLIIVFMWGWSFYRRLVANFRRQGEARDKSHRGF